MHPVPFCFHKIVSMASLLASIRRGWADSLYFTSQASGSQKGSAEDARVGEGEGTCILSE